MLFPAWFQLAVAFFMLLSACIDSLSLLPASWVVSEARLHTHECKIFGLLVAQVLQKVCDKTGQFSHILCSFFRAIRRYINRADRLRRNKMWQNFVMRMSIKPWATMLTKAACTPPNRAWYRPKVDFRGVKVPLYKNKCKFGLNRPWFERACCWKR